MGARESRQITFCTASEIKQQLFCSPVKMLTYLCQDDARAIVAARTNELNKTKRSGSRSVGKIPGKHA